MIDLLEPPLHGVAIYNPRLLSKEELIRTFVARQVELARILESLRREADAQPQHHLVVGARGMGKTTLLNRLRYAIADDEDLSQRCLGLTFPEEQYNVGSLADFWLNCVDALADELEASGRKTILAGLDDEVARVQKLSTTEERRDRALELLCQLADQLERRLVLLVDNVDLVLDRLEDEQWTLREVLSNEARIQLVGATSAPLEAYYRHDKAFYDFFRVHHLEGLSEEETFEVLRELARATGHEHVARLLDAEPARIKTIRLMAGGNPRTVVMLFSLLAQSTEGDVRADIERLLDSCTPLYKHRIEALSMQAQRVLDALAMRWFPSTAAEVAESMHLPVNVVSTQLDRLVRDGTVEKVTLPDTKKHGFQITERFFNIWCLMRASRRVRRRLLWLVDFLRMMFGQEELVRRARERLASRPGAEAVRDAEMALAFADAIEDAALRNALESLSVRLLCRDRTLRGQLAEFLDLEGGDADLTSRVERMKLLAEARELILELDNPEVTLLWEALASELHMTAKEKLDAAASLVGAVVAEGPGALAGISTALQDVRRQRMGSFQAAELEALESAVREGSVEFPRLDLNDLNGAGLVHGPALIPCALASVPSELTPHEEELLLRTGLTSYSLETRIAWARVSLRRGMGGDEVYQGLMSVRDVQAWNAGALSRLGNLLDDMGRFKDAESAYHEALCLDPHHVVTLMSLAAIRLSEGDAEAASALLRQAQERDPTNAIVVASLAMFDIAAQRVVSDERRKAIVDACIKEPGAALLVSIVAISKSDWSVVESIARLFLTATDEFFVRSWTSILSFFSRVVQRDLIPDARKLLAEIGLSDRWEPIDRALDLLQRNDLAGLDRLPPEMREAVRLTIAKIAPAALDGRSSA